MSSQVAIAGVTASLRQLLVQAIPGVTVEEQRSPAAMRTETAPMVGLYLYRAEINPATTNLDWLPLDPGQLAAPPLGLNLHYLVTPYGPDEIEIQRTLGEVMLAFHEHAVLKSGDPLLAPALAPMTEEVRIIPRILPLSDMLDLWRGFTETPYRLCVTYEVATVLIDSSIRRNVTRVQERRITVSAAG